MQGLTLHYLFDPLCGWCYAAAPLVRAARSVAGLQLRWHMGGLLTGERRLPLNAEWRAHITEADDRIALMTGQPFGAAYRGGLLQQNGLVLDSGPPSAAILAAEQLDGRGLDMLAAQQNAYYVRGQPIMDEAVLQALAGELGLDGPRFAAVLQRVQQHELQAHVDGTRALMQQLGARGFPTLAIETPGAEQAMRLIDVTPWLGQAPAWLQALREVASQQGAQAPRHV